MGGIWKDVSAEIAAIFSPIKLTAKQDSNEILRNELERALVSILGRLKFDGED